MSEVISDETMSAAIKTAHNYHDWVFRSFASHLRPGVALEVGSGHGRYSVRILEKVDELIVSDIDPAAVEAVRRELGDHGRVRFVVMSGIDRQKLARPVDDIVLLNVLEHIEDDGAFLDHCRDSLVPGGKLIVFVPAFPLLFSRMDRQAGHFRRYSRTGLERLLNSHGFRVERSRFFNAVGFFGWMANKLAASGVNSGTTNLQVKLYDFLIPLFRPVDRLLPFLGQSLIAIASKKG